MFKRVLVGFMMAVALSTASAEIDTRGLSDSQIAEMKAIAAAKAAENVKSKVEVAKPESVGAMTALAATWGTQAAAAAEGFSRAISIAAKELGVTVNDFLHTDAGRLTALLIIWKVAGASMIKMLYGMLFVTVGLSVARLLWVRLFTLNYKEVQYSRFFGGFTGTKLVRVPKTISQLHNEGEWLVLWMVIIITIATIWGGSAFF